jgi:hypothetical protein
MTTLRKQPRNKNPNPFVLTAKIQGNLPRPWSAMKDPEVLERAQRAVDHTGLADPKSFSKVFRGISFELTRRGLSPEDLDYSFRQAPRRENPKPVPQDKPWPELTDEEFTRRSKEIIHRKGITDWETFKNVCRGIVYQLFKRNLPREELGFSN